MSRKRIDIKGAGSTFKGTLPRGAEIIGYSFFESHILTIWAWKIDPNETEIDEYEFEIQTKGRFVELPGYTYGGMCPRTVGGREYVTYVMIKGKTKTVSILDTVTKSKVKKIVVEDLPLWS